MANGAPNGLPAWIQPMATLVTQLGVPTVLTGVLLWFVLFKMGGTLDHIIDEEDARTRIVQAMQTSFLASQKEQSDAFDKSMQRNIDANKVMTEKFIEALRTLRRDTPIPSPGATQ